MSETPKITGAAIPVAIVIGGKVDEIVQHRLGRELVRDCDEMVDISARPDIKVGDPFPPCSWAEYLESSKKGK